MIDEKGYAVAQDKKLLIFKEEMVTEIGGIHNDAEYVEFSRGNFEKSLIHAIEYILSVSKVPITSTVVNNMVNIHIRQTHTHQDLLESLLKTKQKNPDDFTLRIRISSAHLNMNNIELALKELLHAETDFPNNHDVLHHLGHIFLLKNSYDKAVSYFKLSIEQNAGNGKYFLCLGKAIFGLAKNASDKNISLDFFDEALRKFNHALKYADKSHHGDIQGMIQLTKDALKNPLPKVPVKRR